MSGASDPPRDPEQVIETELRAGRPAIDRVRMDAARARAEAALFAVEAPAQVGRYVVIDTAGTGGMGIVYRAFDPQLDRRVALKVVKAKGLALEGARERLLGEARTLAQLAHPNVVPVHDVLMVGDDLVVVMELVDGVTLEAWAAAEPRSAAELIATYAQAARGLAAAHDVGVIHRDFKPSNALIGSDGRVRVVDFGLARLTGDEGGPGEAIAAGTLAYMAPEQLAGSPTTATVDQFSFWVALYEAVAGARPFRAESPADLLSAIRAGSLAPPRSGRSVPAWFRRAAERGLAFDPDARFASMHEVATELGRVRGWRRWRMPAALGVTTAIAIVAVVRTQTSSGELPCDGGVEDMQAAWGDATRGQVAASLAAAPGSYAREVETRALGGLDEYRARWMDLHRHACVEYRRGALTPNLYERTMACLQLRRTALSAAVGVLGESRPDALGQAVDVVVRLPAVAACGDLASLAADEPPIADPAMRVQVIALRQRLDRATALDAAGRSTEAIQIANAVAAEAAKIDQITVIVDAELLIGRTLVFSGDTGPAVPVLRRAESLALSIGRPAAAVIAGARRIYAEAMEQPIAAPELAREIALLEPLSRSVARDSLARPLLFNNLAAAHQAIDLPDVALQDRQAAERALADVPNPDPELAHVSLNLALVAPDPAERVGLAYRAWQAQRRLFGASHLQALTAEYVLAHAIATPSLAWATVADVCDRYARDHAALVPMRIDCTYHRALWASLAGATAEADLQFAEVVRLGDRTERSDDVSAWRGVALGERALIRGDATSAEAELAAVVAAVGAAPSTRQASIAATARIGLARARLARGDRGGARALLDAAIAILDVRITRNQDALPQQLRARAVELRTEAEPR